MEWLLKFETEYSDEVDPFMDSITDEETPKELLCQIPDNFSELQKEKAQAYLDSIADSFAANEVPVDERQFNAIDVYNAFIYGMKQALTILNIEQGTDFSSFYCMEESEKDGERCQVQCPFCKSV